LSSFRISLGSLFQSDGTAAVKALSPSVFFVFVDGEELQRFKMVQIKILNPELKLSFLPWFTQFKHAICTGK